MEILIIGKFTKGQFGYHIFDAFKDMGHNVFTYDASLSIKYPSNSILLRIYQFNNLLYDNLLMTSTFKNIKRKRLYEILKNNKIDLIICTHDILQPDEIKKIRGISKSKITMWFPDSIANFNKAFFMISDYDAIFFKDPYIVDILREQYNKKNVYYLPECCNPKYHKFVELNNDDRQKYGCDITTYGSPHNIRSSFFVQLLEYNYKINIWGQKAPIWLEDKTIKSLYTGEYVFNESKAKSVLAAKINLNTLLPSEIYGLNARTFEVAGIGGFQIIHWRPGLAQLFEDRKELISFKNFDELKLLINHYLDHEEERKEIARNGQQRAYREHTYTHRLELLIKTILGNEKGYKMPEFIKNSII